MNSESRFSEDAAIDRIALGQLNRRAVEIRCDGGTRAGRNDDAAVLWDQWDSTALDLVLISEHEIAVVRFGRRSHMQPEPWAQCECVGVGVVADAAESVEDLVDGRVGEFLGAFFWGNGKSG